MLRLFKPEIHITNISGLIIGKVLPDTKFVDGSSFNNILYEVVKAYNFPVLIDADFGHIENPICIPYGINLSLDI